MSGPIIRTMWLDDDELYDLRAGQTAVYAQPSQYGRHQHPVLVIHAPEMPGFRAGDRVRNMSTGEEVRVDGVYLDERGAWCFVGYDADIRPAHGWSRIAPEPVEPPNPEPDPRTVLTEALSAFKVGTITSSAMTAALDDYISRALGRERIARTLDQASDNGEERVRVEVVE